jgi:hypothetical protein
MSNFQNPNVSLPGGRIRAHIPVRWRCANPCQCDRGAGDGHPSKLISPEVAEPVG